ncbi:hypothetical protein [Stenotrophomonas sp. NRRL B-14846]|uniref:hypothetical protein n=1 Tax=Stenotrophomonas sp. NRRL B-14846 TaxID=3162882 RepID=UPI003D2CDEDA
MSAPVDVLAVLDRAIESAGLMVKASGDLRAVAYQDDLFKARAAVAELIEADKRIAERARRKAGGGWWMISNEDMTAQRTALARVKGGAA